MTTTTKAVGVARKIKWIQLGPKKICKTGAYTCTISIPKVWMKNTGSVAGDIVDIEMAQDGSLIIRPAKKK